MFKFSAVSQIWKKYIQKLNDWDLPLTTDYHQALVAERSKALQLSCRGLAGCEFESRWRHIFSFWIFRSLPVPNRSMQPLQMKQACPFTWSHSCFRPQLWFIIQGLVYKYLQYSFNITINDILVIYVTAYRCAGGLKKKLDLRSGSERHRHFVRFFNVPVLAPTRERAR